MNPSSGVRPLPRYLPILSVVIPTLNEEAELAACLQSIRGEHIEVLVVDGGSTDSTRKIAEAGGARVIESPRGRGTQMGRGAREARGEAMLFLHADTRLPRGAVEQIREAIRGGAVGGGFRMLYDDRGWRPRLFAGLSNLRMRLTRLPYGDQAQFIRHEVYDQLGGFPGWPLMEDVALAKKMRRAGRVVLLRGPVVTSARRQKQMGYVRYWLLCQRVKLLHAIGVRPERLGEVYTRAVR